jgi:hypothetical protein
MAQDRDKWRALVNTVMNAAGSIPRCTTGALSRRGQLHGVSYGTLTPRYSSTIPRLFIGANKSFQPGCRG